MKALNMKLHPWIGPLFILIMTGTSNVHASRDVPFSSDFPYTSDE